MLSKRNTLGFQLAFGTVLFFLVIYFHQGPGGNSNSRLLTVYGLVENGTFQADGWADTTFDRAIIEGHVYSDKAPLSSLLVVPFYAAWRAGGGIQSPRDQNAALHIATLVASTIPYVAFGLLLLRRLRTTAGLTPNVVVWGLLTALFGTFVYQYAHGYFGHILGGLLMVRSVELATRFSRFQSGQRDTGQPFLAGLLGALSFAAEYPLAITQIILLIYLAYGRRFRGLIAFSLGAAGPIVGLLAYNAAITGGVLKFPYQFATNFPAMKETLGFGSFSFDALWGMSFSLFRGAFVFGPPLLLALWPWTQAEREPTRPAAHPRSLAPIIAAAHLLFFCCYAYWDGGQSAGPRFLVPAAMLLIYDRLPIILAWPRGRVSWITLGFAGIALQGMMAATEPLAPASYLNPIAEFYWPSLLRGQFNPHTLLFEWGLPRTYGPLTFRLWYALILAGGLLFARWWAAIPIVGMPSVASARQAGKE